MSGPSLRTASFANLDTRIEEHTRWLCNNRPEDASSECQWVNGIDERDCGKCGRCREAGAEALNDINDVIGELKHVLFNGEENWEYFPTETGEEADAERIPINAAPSEDKAKRLDEANANETVGSNSPGDADVDSDSTEDDSHDEGDVEMTSHSSGEGTSSGNGEDESN